MVIDYKELVGWEVLTVARVPGNMCNDVPTTFFFNYKQKNVLQTANDIYVILVRQIILRG